MKMFLILLFIGLLLLPLFGQNPIQFSFETDADTYEYGQNIQITYVLYNPNSEPVDLELSCLTPFGYYIDDVMYNIECYPAITPITIEPYSSYTQSMTHTETVSFGNHYMYGFWLHDSEYYYSPYVYIDVVGTNADAIELFAQDVSLSNYPNPFNPQTTISFSLPQESHVELSLFDSKGRHVKTLVQAVLEHGEQVSTWQGDDDNGNPVSSGIYLYQLVLDGTTEAVGKCLLLK